MTDRLHLLQPLAFFAKTFSVELQKVLATEMTSIYHAVNEMK